MKLLMQADPGHPLGVELDGIVLFPRHDAFAGLSGSHRCASVVEVLRRGKEGLDQLQHLVDWALSGSERTSALHEDGALAETQQIELKPPLGQPPLIVCSGRSYGKHVAEMGGEVTASTVPNAFLKNSHTVVAHGEAIQLPSGYSSMVDYEGEIGVVIGRPCHGCSLEDAMSFVGGYTIVNDVSARDWNPQQGGAPNWDLIRLGKQFPTFCPMGPWITTADAVDDPADMHLQTHVNGKLRQAASTSDLIHSIAKIISYYSKWYPFMTGDVITLGTPDGVGAGCQPPRYLRHGDRVDVTVDCVGTLSNPVLDGSINTRLGSPA